MLVIPISSNLYEQFSEIAQTRRMVFMAGLPGVGKSLLIQQLTLIANQAGRKVHLIQWDVSRQAFEIPQILDSYPEVDGVTDPIIRMAAGRWARSAVYQWHNAHPDPENMLIGEVPLIGNRLIELTQVMNDDAEAVLSSSQVLFVTPVPSWEVRAVIEKAREKSIANPQNENEKLDAPPNVLRALWREVNDLARQIGLTKAGPDTPYNPYIYAGVYEALLQNRHSRSIPIDQVLRPKQSVYDLDVVKGQLRASTREAVSIIEQLENQYSRKEIVDVVANWHSTLTQTIAEPDRGPELRLPLPETLESALSDTALTDEHIRCLREVVQLPVEAAPDELLPVVDQAIACLGVETAVSQANVHKFDIYDSYFNVTRTEEESGRVFLAGLLQSYRNMLINLETEHDLTVIELPLLRVALDSILQLFLTNRRAQ